MHILIPTNHPDRFNHASKAAEECQNCQSALKAADSDIGNTFHSHNIMNVHLISLKL